MHLFNSCCSPQKSKALCFRKEMPWYPSLGRGARMAFGERLAASPQSPLCGGRNSRAQQRGGWSREKDIRGGPQGTPGTSGLFDRPVPKAGHGLIKSQVPPTGCLSLNPGSITSCVTLGKLPNLSVPRFPIFNGESYGPCHIRFFVNYSSDSSGIR